MKQISFFILLLFCAVSYQDCPPTAMGVFNMLSENLWGVETLRKNLFAALSTARSSTTTQSSYFSLTTIMDGLRRRHIDLYPILSKIADLKTQHPQQQLISVLETLTNQKRISGAVTEIINELRMLKINVNQNLTKGLDKVRTVQDNKPTRFALNLIRDRIRVCPPSQNLIGAVLVNVPVRSHVAEARYDISQSLRDGKIPAYIWDTTIINLPIKNMALVSWLQLVVKTIAAYTNDDALVQEVANGILQFDEEPLEEIQPLGIERWRRSVGDQLEPKVRTLSKAIAEYTLSLIRQKLDDEKEQLRTPPPPPQPQPLPPPPQTNKPHFFLSAHDMINQIQQKIAKQVEQTSSSEETSGETNIAIAIGRSNSANNTES